MAKATVVPQVVQVVSPEKIVLELSVFEAILLKSILMCVTFPDNMQDTIYDAFVELDINSVNVSSSKYLTLSNEAEKLVSDMVRTFQYR